jgi:hypothetical protein
MKRHLAILTTFAFMLSIAFALKPQGAMAGDRFDAIIAARNSPIQGLPACIGVSNGLLRNGLTLVQSEVCTDFTQIMGGTQNGNNIGNDLGTLLTDLQTEFNLPTFCAASLMLVFAQQIVDGQISVGSCPGR